MPIPNYHEYRQEILNIASLHKLHIHSIEMDKGPKGEPLFCDILSTSIDSSKPTYVHIAGCHGVEGYLGSLIQRKYLQSLSTAQLAKFNIVIIHPLCPYGMAWYRRVNSQNIDLNRNFFTTTERPNNRGFAALLPLLNSKNKFEFATHVITTSLQEGYVASQRVLGQGQYQFADKPFYGGHAVQEEILQVLGYVQNLLRDVHEFTIFDIHSGLGKPGVEMIFGSEDFNELKKKHPEKYFTNLKSQSWETTGNLGEAFKHFFANAKVIHVVLEFGTAGNLFVLYALTQDHQHFSQNKTDPKRIESMLKAFFLPEHLQDFAIAQAFKTFEIMTGVKTEYSPKTTI